MGELGWLLLIGAAAYVWMQKRSAANLVFFPGSITNIGFQGITPVLTATLQVQNTSNVDFVISSMAANVYVNNTLIGNVSSFTPTPIPRNSQQLLVMNVQLQLIGLVDDIINAFTGGSMQQNIVVDGFVNGNNVQVPLNITYKIGG